MSPCIVRTTKHKNLRSLEPKQNGTKTLVSSDYKMSRYEEGCVVKQPKSVFEALSVDQLTHIALFLKPIEVLRVEQTCRAASVSLFYWSEYCKKYIPNALPLDSHVHVQVQYEDSEAARRIVLWMAMPTKTHPAYRNNTLDFIREVSASSVDRPEEVAENTSEPSVCHQLINEIKALRSDTSFDNDAVGLYAQIRCGCARNAPCYWSSKPSKRNDNVEYITLVVQQPGVLFAIAGLSITPYQAFHHPDQPIYSPQGACVQFIMPAAGRCGQDLVYFESEVFIVEKIYEKQFFEFPESVLFLGGIIRIVFPGMLQRQTIGEEAGEHHDDYYICISHIELHGTTVGGVNVNNVVSESSTDP